MFPLDWYRQYKEIKHENDYCEYCNSLKLQLALVQEEKRLLLNKILETPVEKVVTPVQGENPKALMPPSGMNWNMRRQILERESREAAKLARRNAEASRSAGDSATMGGKPLTIHEIEKELGVEDAV